ncbi:MAG TPA: N-6 DNA methylase [Planctomycetota bacterium]|nr:N-6 DNA methylase [Planctomycetota bacterium]
MASTTVVASFKEDASCALSAARTPAVRPKILRSSAFGLRRHTVEVRDWLRPILAEISDAPPGVAVLTVATALAARSRTPAPERWLNKLANAFGLSRLPAAPAYEHVPKAVWNEPSLLGEVLLAARARGVQPERRGRAGRVSAGAVYTPAAVARAIVSEVHVGARRVVDPACGAGVFLLEAFTRAFQRRLEAGAAPLQAASGALTHEISGIDIDSQALAVAEFSLRLSALQLGGLDRDVPIDLRHANALEPLEGLDGACECIVGNPPFVEGRGLKAAELQLLREKFRCAASGKVNLFAVFVERSLSLLKDGGVMALVLPATFQRNTRYLPLRELLLNHTLEAIRPLDNCFGGRVVETVVLRVRKRPPEKTSIVQLSDGSTLQSRLPLGPVLRFCDHLPRKLRRQIELMERHGVPLSGCFEVKDGISTGFQPFPLKLLGTREGDQFISADGTRRPFDEKIHRRIIDGCEFNSFTPVEWAGRYIEYDKRHEHFPPHPGKPFNCQLRDAAIYDRAEKLLSRQTAKGIIATVDRERFFVRNSVHVTFAKSDLPPELSTLSLEALCGVLNTQFYTDYLLAMTGEDGIVFPQVHIADLKRLPILPGLLKADGHAARLGAALLQAARESDNAALTALKQETEELLRSAFGL